MPGHLEKRYKSSWTIVIDNGRDENGKRIRITKSVKGTKREAEKEMLRMLHEIEQGTYVKPSELTLGEYLKRWLEDYGKPNLAPTTYENYRYIINAHLIPALGNIKLSKLQPMQLQAYYSKALQKGRRDGKGGLSPRSVRYHHTILREALSHAVQWQIVARNVAEVVEPPKAKKPEIKVLNEAEVQKFLSVIKGHKYFALIYTALLTGMRKSELLGLRWQDVNLEDGIIYVQQSLHRLRNEGFITKPPKTKKSRRGITIPASLLSLFRSMNKTHELVFCHPDGRPLEPSDISHQFQALANKAGFPGLRFHDLRHTHATLLLQQGVHPKVVQERLGHESIMVTLDTYSHVLPGLQEAAANKLDDILGQRFGNENKK